MAESPDFDPHRAIPGKPLMSLVDVCAAQQERISELEAALDIAGEQRIDDQLRIANLEAALRKTLLEKP